MRLGLEWLRDWVPTEEPAERIADRLTMAGLEVEAVLAAAPTIVNGVRVASIKSFRRHPDASRLSVCEVDDGDSLRVVVCGAPNVSRGARVALALPGAELPGGRLIGEAEIRGVVSSGMLCSAFELGLGDAADALVRLDDSAPLGEDLVRYLKLDDHILDVNLTPNRGDCFSVLGIAREVAAGAGLSLRGPSLSAVKPVVADTFPVVVTAAEACPRFAGRVVRGIRPEAETPLWVRERLRRAGVRPIHPAVDVTNYVMLELGQPLHGYDLSKLSRQIEVRFARDGEPLTLLDGTEVVLDRSLLVIADGDGAVGLAGIMGGARTAIDASTRDVFLESAFFAPAAVGGRARRYGLHTDASMRFERGVDPAEQVRAIEYATALLLEIAGGEPGPVELCEHARHLPERRPIRLRSGRLERLLGLSVERSTVTDVLARLGLEVEEGTDAWTVTPPSFRFDLEIEEDLIEEVGRMLGYDSIPVAAGAGAAHLGEAPETRVDAERAADWLIARGYQEVVNYAFVDGALAEALRPGEQRVRLANPISQDLDVMRGSLWPGLLTTAQRNLARQQPRLRLFELGRQFASAGEQVCETEVLAGLAIGSRWGEQWGAEAVEVDYFDVKADLEALLSLTGRAHEIRFVPAEHPALQPGRSARLMRGQTVLGWLGVTHPETERRLDLKQSAVLFELRVQEALEADIPAFESYPKFPVIRRDLAVVVDEEISAEQLVDAAHAAGGALVKEVIPFDVYRGSGIDSRRKSVALGLILQGTSRTLTDEDADQAMRSVTRHLERELGATIRTQ